MFSILTIICLSIPIYRLYMYIRCLLVIFMLLQYEISFFTPPPPLIIVKKKKALTSLFQSQIKIDLSYINNLYLKRKLE